METLSYIDTLLDINKALLELNGRKYHLINVAGCGGSSIVYKARKEGNNEDFVVIKEFCPHNLNIQRNTDGSIYVNNEKIPEYKKLMARAENEYVIANKLRYEKENNDPWFLYYGKPIPKNNTLYTVIATEKGDMLSDIINNGFFKEKDFIYICDCMLKILDALKFIHNKKYLHLDISPDNILFSDLGIARLIDYNSAFRLDDDIKDWIPSKKLGYSADELVNFVSTKFLSCQTDFYSITAIFFELLIGRIPENNDWVLRRWWQLTNESRYLAGASNLLIKKTSKFLQTGLSVIPTERFKNIE